MTETNDPESYMNQHYLYIIAGAYRYGTLTFMTRIDFELPNKPDHIDYDDENDDENYTIKNPDDIHLQTTGFNNTEYIVIGVHHLYKDFCAKLADEMNMFLSPGRPMHILRNEKGEEKTRHFPLSHPEGLLFTLKYKPGYDFSEHNPDKLELLLQKEVSEIEDYMTKRAIVTDLDYESDPQVPDNVIIPDIVLLDTIVDISDTESDTESTLSAKTI